MSEKKDVSFISHPFLNFANVCLKEKHIKSKSKKISFPMFSESHFSFKNNPQFANLGMNSTCNIHEVPGPGLTYRTGRRVQPTSSFCMALSLSESISLNILMGGGVSRMANNVKTYETVSSS